MGRRKKRKGPLAKVAMPKMDIAHETKKGIFVVLIILLGVLSFLSLFDLAGSFGQVLDKGQEMAFGWGKWIFPLLLVVWGIFLYKEEKSYIRGANVLGLLLLLISVLALFHFFLPVNEWKEAARAGYGGGLVGMYLARGFRNVLGFWGGLVGLIALTLVSFMLVFNTSLVSLFGEQSLFAKIFYPLKFITSKFFNGKDEEEMVEQYEEVEEEEEEADDSGQDDEEVLDFSKKIIADAPQDDELAEDEEKDLQNIKKQDADRWKASKIKIDLPIDLLGRSTGKPTSGDIKNNALIIQKTFENFGIPVAMADTAIGPTVTQYSFKPAEGVKLSRITTLSNDLALALAAHPIRIEAPIPGKSLVGIEVPNKSKAIVALREVIENSEFKAAKSNLTVALGKDVAGRVWSYDIGKMPHLLVAGATGSGKSVCLNAIILSLLYQNDPENLRFIFVDPKRVELTVYDGIPHLLTPVITNVSKTVNALRWCLNEMDRRFELLAQHKKRNIEAYNKTAKEKMPYIVFIIDELADLMVAAAKDIESSVIRLTQMARAVGIHLILATQRPSVDVITGLIKANTPARIAFSVASAIDSKTILDSQGAEKLIGKGDMLFLTAEISKPKRLQGALVTDEEIKRVVDYIKDKSGEFEYVDGVTERQKVGGIAGVGLEGNINDDVDELFADAKEIVVSSGKASASLLQRRLSIGYARAARIMDELEEAGIIGPSNGAKPREILMTKEQMEAQNSSPTAGASLHNRDEAEAPDSYLGEDDEDENSLGEVPESPASMSEEEEEEEEESDEEEIGEDDEKKTESEEEEDDDEK
ncbi:hypothetical protein GF382_03195, partial [Candidatus Falkowbacteria bacterium]|nr:hypothetical protein [Candidatus Falkowbacteria bacterium]